MHYQVQLVRKVQNSLSVKKIDIHFRGKNQEAQAKKGAYALAEAHKEEASSVSVWRLTASGNGVGEYLKEEDVIFPTDFPPDWKPIPTN